MKRLVHLCSLVLLSILPLSASSNLLGTVLIRGSGFLNDQPVVGFAANLGSGDRLTTGAKSGAIITISDSDTLVMGENSRITLTNRPEGVAAELERGHVLVTTNHKRLIELRLPGESASVSVSPGAPSSYQVTRETEITYVLPGRGKVSIYKEGKSGSTEVPQGMMGIVRSDTNSWEIAQARPVPAQQSSAAAGQRAGQIALTIPADYVVRGPQQMTGTPGTEILLNDLLKTEGRGRMRVALDDGSILTVGSGSQFKVLEHNVQSQQSNIEMLYGKMRVQVMKKTAPNAKFEIRTATAVCGVLGTDFYIEATARRTRVIVFEGIVRLTSLVAGIAAVTLSQGQTAVSSANSVSSPSQASASQTQTAANITNITAASVASASTFPVTIVLASAAGATAAGVAIPLALQSSESTPSSPFQP